MIASQITIGLILILCGFLVKKFPNLIAGYNTMSQIEKDKININLLSTFLKQLLIGIGVFTIVIYFILKWLEFTQSEILLINTVFLTTAIIVGLIYANTNKKFKN